MKCPHYIADRDVEIVDHCSCHGELPEVAPKQEGLPKELFAWCKQHNYPCGKQAKGECDCMLCDMVWNAALSRGWERVELVELLNRCRIALCSAGIERELRAEIQSRLSARGK